MAISIVRLGSTRRREEGLRLGTVRRPPRGVPKARFASEDWYDVWLPALSPSAALMARTSFDEAGKWWPVFARRFRAELKKPDASRLLDVLAALSHQTNFSVGCYCEDEHQCHRSLLRRELSDRGAIVN
jgi:uncharacterized protein YeaO (DUF488 family)